MQQSSPVTQPTTDISSYTEEPSGIHHHHLHHHHHHHYHVQNSLTTMSTMETPVFPSQSNLPFVEKNHANDNSNNNNNNTTNAAKRASTLTYMDIMEKLFHKDRLVSTSRDYLSANCGIIETIKQPHMQILEKLSEESKHYLIHSTSDLYYQSSGAGDIVSNLLVHKTALLHEAIDQYDTETTHWSKSRGSVPASSVAAAIDAHFCEAHSNDSLLGNGGYARNILVMSPSDLEFRTDLESISEGVCVCVCVSHTCASF